MTGNGLLNLLGIAPVNTAGVDVSGTINGIGATGSGQTLTGATATDIEGLAIKITGGATGARGTLNFSQGIAYRLDTLATSFLNTTGAIATFDPARATATTSPMPMRIVPGVTTRVIARAGPTRRTAGRRAGSPPAYLTTPFALRKSRATSFGSIFSPSTV
jgi:hypothetical protein